ncbi:MAG: thiamine diphosphokinase [Bellilinea sp.]
MENLRAVVFANGELADPAAVRAFLRSDDTLVAADGGYSHMKQVGVQPHLLIGDFDSLPAAEVESLRAAGVEVKNYPSEKDETDLELALAYLAEQGFREIRVVAALGGRLDQTLANLYLLEMEELRGIDVRLDDGHEEILAIRDRAAVSGTPGDTLSLLPMEGCTRGITTRGLKYALDGETLCPSRSRGVSNVMLEPEVNITVQSGALLCIHTRQNAARL